MGLHHERTTIWSKNRRLYYSARHLPLPRYHESGTWSCARTLFNRPRDTITCQWNVVRAVATPAVCQQPAAFGFGGFSNLKPLRHRVPSSEPLPPKRPLSTFSTGTLAGGCPHASDTSRPEALIRPSFPHANEVQPFTAPAFTSNDIPADTVGCVCYTLFFRRCARSSTNFLFIFIFIYLLRRHSFLLPAAALLALPGLSAEAKPWPPPSKASRCKPDFSCTGSPSSCEC